MKKIFKNKTFILIISCVLLFSVGVIAANKYNANQFMYSDTETLNEAINRVYSEKISDTSCKTSKFKVGDYVSMTPTVTSYPIDRAKTGYDNSQTINPSELNLWRVIKVNDDCTVEMVSEYVSSVEVYFYGKTGYLNYIGYLNTLANQYQNSKYTIKARHMGYSNQTKVITDTSKFTNPAPWTTSTGFNTVESQGGGDSGYINDINLVANVVGHIQAYKVGTKTASNYWIASRLFVYHSSTYYEWFVNHVWNSNGNVSPHYLYNYRNGFNEQSFSGSLRPIVTLKSGLNPTGSGTNANPYVLN